MLALLGIVSIISNCIDGIKTATTKPLPPNAWENNELYMKDLGSGMSMKQIMKNAENGKYALPVEKYAEPHRDPKSGKIIIENCKLYREDLKKYGAVQVGKWVKQGKYNLSPEELKKIQRT